MSKLLIIGCSGFLGKFVSSSPVLNEKFEIIDSKSLGFDFRDRDSIDRVIDSVRPDHVVNLGAIASLEDLDIQDLYRVNSFGVLDLLDSLAKIKFEGVFLSASSAYVYGAYTPFRLSERDCVSPHNHYACSKLLAEKFCQFSGLNAISLRFFNVIGPGQRESFLIPKIVNHFKLKSNTMALGNLDIIRDYFDIRELPELIGILLSTSPSIGVLNVCSGKGVSLQQIINGFSEVSGHTLHVTSDPALIKSNDNTYMIGDKTLLEKIAFSPRFSINDSIRFVYEEM